MVDQVPRRVTWHVLIDDQGRWKDISVHCYPVVEDRERYKYFQTSEGLLCALDTPPTPFNKKGMDKEFGGYKHLDRGSTFGHAE